MLEEALKRGAADRAADDRTIGDSPRGLGSTLEQGSDVADDAAGTNKAGDGIDIVMGNWRGVFGAPGITAAQRQALVDYITALHATPAWREIVARQGWDDAFLVGQDFASFLARDEAATGQVLRDIGLAS